MTAGNVNLVDPDDGAEGSVAKSGTSAASALATRTLHAYFSVPASITDDELASTFVGGQGTKADPGFGPDQMSLFPGGVVPPGTPANVTSGVVWRRLPGSLYVDGARAGDVVQGALGDCWFLSAVSALSAQKDLLLDVFVSDEHADKGIYSFRFYKNGTWVEVAVDDLLPCAGVEADSPLFARSADRGELWVALLEKAYAKLHGSYFALDGGSIAEALVDLTGGSCLKLSRRDPKVQAACDSGEFWDDLQLWSDRRCVMGASRAAAGSATEEDTGNGILANHAYAILQVRTVHSGERMVQLRNPWGMKEWTGDWSDASPKWHDPRYAGIVQELDQKFEDDGTFWMSYEDFVSHFSKFYACRTFPEKVWHRQTLKNAWAEESAGGGPLKGGLMSGTWANNPQYRVVVKAKTKVVISLMQRDWRLAEYGRTSGAPGSVPGRTSFNHGEEDDSDDDEDEEVAGASGRSKKYEMCGLTVLKADRKQKKRTWEVKDEHVVAEMGEKGIRENAIEVVLEAGEAYNIVPHTLYSGVECPFVLRLFSERPLEVVLLPPNQIARISSRWAPATCGGRRLDDTFGSNPQFLLEAKEATDALIILRRTDVIDVSDQVSRAFDSDQALSFVVIKSPQVMPRQVVSRPSEDLVHNEPYFTSMWETSQTMRLGDHEKDYIVVPCTARPKSFGDETVPFELEILSSKPVNLLPFPASASREVSGAWDGASAGGCDLRGSSFDMNPRYVLTHAAGGEGSVDSTYSIQLEVPPSFQKPVKQPLNGMLGFYVYKVKREDCLGSLNRDHRLVHESAFLPMKSVEENVQLSGTAGDRFLVIPCTFGDGVKSNFKLTVVATVPFELISVHDLADDQEDPN